MKDEDTYQEMKEVYQERWEACRKWSHKRGINYIVLTDVDIRDARFTSVWFTYGSSKQHDNEKYMAKIEQFIPDEGIAFNPLCRILSENFRITINKSSQMICYAIYHGFVFVPTFSTKVLNKNTVIRRRENKKQPPFRPLYEELNETLLKRDEEQVFKVELKSVKKMKEVQFIENDNEELSEKQIIVKEFINTPSFQRDKVWRADFEKKHDVPISTVYKWVRKYKESGLEGLKDKYHKSGRNSKWDEKAIEMLEEARQFYLSPLISYKKAYKKKLKYGIIPNWMYRVCPHLSDMSKNRQHITKEKYEGKEVNELVILNPMQNHSKEQLCQCM